MNILDISGIRKTYGARVILEDAACTVDEADRIGLIGRNGSGKSTLLKLMAGSDEADAGTIMRKKGLTVGYLSQEPDLDERSTVAEEIERGLSSLRKALDEYTKVVDAAASRPADADRLLHRQGELAAWIEQHGGWNTDHRVAEIMSHLNIPRSSEPISKLSGGMKRRVALARVLIQAPDLMLLDEPTNHLDADSTEWLQEFLKNYRGAVILITHDRYFLDEVTERIIEVEGGILTSFTGGYSGYVEAKAEKLQQAAERKSRLLNLFRNESAWMHRGAKARSTKQKARIDRFHALAEEAATSRDRELKMSFQSGDTLGGIVIEADKVSKAFSGRTLMKDLTFGMKRGERIGIIGPNGSGKTTLIRMILGMEKPDSGAVRLGKKAEVAYFDQNRVIEDDGGTLYDYLGEGDYVETPTGRRHKIGYLEDFLFEPSDRMRKIYTLSGGERGRLILAKLMLGKANILILDEPTNDLDIPTLQLLDEALADFPGCVLMVTHDRFFLDKVATSILAFEGEGRVVKYEGNYTLYRALKEKEPIPAAAAVVQTPTKQVEVKKKAGLTYAERIELEQVEENIAILEPKKVEMENMLADPACYAELPGGIEKLSRDFLELEESLATLYGRWEELELKRSA